MPFITGGAEALVTSLRQEFISHGHECEIVSIPFKWYPPERLLDCMAMARLMDLTEVNGQRIDKVVAMKFPAYYVEHPNKTFWVMHQHRQAYELFGTEHSDLHQSELGERVSAEIQRWDNVCFRGRSNVYTISKTVADRLEHFNKARATPLYPPPLNYKKYQSGPFGDFVFYAGRFSPMKRQHLLIEALAITKNPVRAVLVGSPTESYGAEVLRLIKEKELSNRVECRGIVDEEEKLTLYSQALSVYNGVYQEDYGYLTLEAFFASKPVVTHTDSGGPLEFVQSRVNGFVTEPTPEALATALDELYENRDRAKNYGKAGRLLLKERDINWETVVEALLG